MKKLPQDIGTIHFVGIGGIGMSGIAEILHSMDYQIQGSDLGKGQNVQRLSRHGVRIFDHHDASNLVDEDGEPVAVMVISSAIKDNNPEIIAAREQKIPVVRRAEMLAELMRLKWSIAIAGTHGKTTTTSLVGTMLETAGFDPTVINGGIINAYGTNTRLGLSDWMVVEADESDGTFTRLPATAAVVTNIDPEHLDFYGKFDHVKLAYRRFIENLPFYGFAVICIDHPVVKELMPVLQDRRVLTYGKDSAADLQLHNIRYTAEGCVFDLTVKGWVDGGDQERHLNDIALPMYGEHNISNAVAAIGVAMELGVSDQKIKESLSKFTGVKRRFTLTGVVNDIRIIDDYGHHPVEIKAVLKAAKQAVSATGGKIIAVMQPHRYTRLHDLFDEFASCFDDADIVYVSDVYAAGEDKIDGATNHALVEAIKKKGAVDKDAVFAFDDEEALPALIENVAAPGDFVICLGAGSISNWANDLPAQLEAIIKKPKQGAV